MSKTQVINLINVHDKWLKLMLHLQNALTGAFQLIFPDADTARIAANRMNDAVDRHSEWFNLVICKRGSYVYVFKTQNVQKVVIRDELFSN